MSLRRNVGAFRCSPAAAGLRGQTPLLACAARRRFSLYELFTNPRNALPSSWHRPAARDGNASGSSSSSITAGFDAPPLSLFDPFASPVFAPPMFAFHRPVVMPPVRVSEKSDGSVRLELDTPRFAAEDVTVATDEERGLVVVRGARRDEGGEHAFERSYSVNADVLDLGKAATTVANGLVTVVIPRKNAQQQQQQQEGVPSDKAPVEVTEGKKKDAAGAPAADGSKDGVTTVGDAAAFEAVARMAWPPAFKLTDGADELEFSCALPPAVKAADLDIRLQRRGALHVGLSLDIDSVRKDTAGNIVHSESRSLNFATPLAVPPNTQESDVRASLKGGVLRITVAKHPADADRGKINISEE